MDRELGWEGASKGNTRGKGDKTGENRGNGEKGNERGGLGKGEGRGLIYICIYQGVTYLQKFQ